MGYATLTASSGDRICFLALSKAARRVTGSLLKFELFRSHTMFSRKSDAPTSFTDRLFHILDIISAADSPLSIQEVTNLSALPQPTVHRIVAQLETLDLVVRDPRKRRILIGPRLFQVSLNTMQASCRQGPTRAVLRELSQYVDESCALGILDKDEVVYIGCVEASWPLSLQLRTGSRVPLHCTSIGKVMLAHLPTRQRDRLLSHTTLARYTDKTVTDVNELKAVLEGIRQAGFTITNQEYIPGVVGVAVGVFGRHGRVLAGLSIRAPEVRLSFDRARELVPTLQNAAQKISALWEEQE